MADPRFFTVAGPFPLSTLARISDGELGPGADPAQLVYDVAPLEAAGPNEISFLDNRKYLTTFFASRAGACVVPPELARRAPPEMALLLTKEPYRGYALIAQAFHPNPTPSGVVDPRAVIDPSARLGAGTEVVAGAFIGPRVEIGKRCLIDANAVIGLGVVLGDDCIVGAHVSLSHCRIGNRVVIYPGARLGQDGFGFAISRKGFTSVPQLGRVIVGDDVEIGANTTIDRGAGPDTVIGNGCRIDNLVQIGHNVQLGQGCVVVAQVGISGSTRVGDSVMIGGQAGLTGHLCIGSRARIGAQAGVIRDVAANTTVMGTPALKSRDYWRHIVVLKQMVRRSKVKESEA